MDGELRSEMWTGSLSMIRRDGLIEDMAKRHLKILQAQIDGLWDNLIAKEESLKEYPLAQRRAWKPPPRGKLKWNGTALEQKRSN